MFALALGSYVSTKYLWFGNAVMNSLWEFCFIIFPLIVLLKMIKFNYSMSKLNASIEKLSDRQTQVENKIEKISMQANQLHNKLIKISSKITPQERNLGIIEQTEPKIEQNFINDQLELNIQRKNNGRSEEAFQNKFLSWDMLLRALNFPNDENDLEGFTALNLARENNTIFQFLQVSEDFLNLLAQDGIYLDDLKIDPPSVKAWVNFINNKQNEHCKKLTCSGIDEHIKTLKIRLKSDVVFRDTALMLMRRFDKLLQDRLESAEDHQIFKIADTRSGKAFLVVGKISDAF